MTGVHRHEPTFSDESIETLARSVEPHDHERIAAPAQVWDNILAELEVEVAESEASARARERRSKFVSPNILAIAAAMLLLVGVVGVLSLRNKSADQLKQVAAATMTDAGLQVATDAIAEARVVCDGDRCVVEVELTSVPDAGDGDLELWVINGDVSDMHSLGNLTDGGSFDLPDGVDYVDFPIVDISIEPRDGVATHSGQSVLRGLLLEA